MLRALTAVPRPLPPRPAVLCPAAGLLKFGYLEDTGELEEEEEEEEVSTSEDEEVAALYGSEEEEEVEADLAEVRWCRRRRRCLWRCCCSCCCCKGQRARQRGWQAGPSSPLPATAAS